MHHSGKSCQMLIRLWDDDLEEWHQIQIKVPGKPDPGPKDDYLATEGSFAKPDQNGDFIGKNYTEEQLDAIHAFAVARLTIDLWEKALDKKVNWPWPEINDGRLKMVLYSGRIDASFKKATGSVLLGNSDPNWMLTCRSIDIVAHEVTHALIESFDPGIHDSGTLNTYAIIEALADLSSIFIIVSNPQLFKYALNKTDTDFHQKSFLSEFAEGFSEDSKSGIRSALTIDLENQENPCSLGSRVVRKVYEMLVKSYELKNYNYDPDLSQILLALVYRTFDDKKNISMKEFVRRLRK